MAAFDNPRVTPKQRAMIADLVAVGLYGETPAEVVSYLIARGLDDLLRAGVIEVQRTALAKRAGPPPLPGESLP